MNVTVDDVKKYLALGQELVGLGVVLLPEGKTKEVFKKVQVLLEKDVLVEAVVAGFKLYDEAKVFLN